MLRRGLLSLPLALAACAGRPSEPETLPPLVSGYSHLTPIRLDVAAVDIVQPAPGVVRVSTPAPLNPAQEMARMAQDRLVAAGTAGGARFIIRIAEFRRETLPGPGGLTGMFAGDPGERLTVRMQARLEVSAPDGRSGFVEAEARRQRTLPDGSSTAERRRAAEEVVRQAMDDLNVEFEFQVRRTLRGWIVETITPPTGADGVQIEELPRS